MPTTAPAPVSAQAPAPSAADWSYVAPFARAPRRLADRYLLGLSVCLLGYALFGRAFAYLGVPPVFVGEVMLAVGLVLLVATPERARGLWGPPMVVGALLLGWVLFRTVPYVGRYGIDALRDAMVAGYFLYAVVVAGLVLSRPERIPEVLARYRTLVVVVGTLGWVLYLVYRINKDVFPAIPWAPHVRVVENKPGDLVVHMAGITAFVVLGWRRASPVLLAALVVGTGASMAGGRGGMMGFVVAMGAFALLKPARARFGRMVYVGALLVIVGLAVDTSGMEINEGNRSLSVEQLWENVKSVFGQSDQAMLETTTEWRVLWWTEIVDYTVFDDARRWTGKGFGVNLATDDGFQVEAEETLRSPHNVHLTYLARGGVPGLVLWVLLQGSWAWAVARAWLRARRQRLDGWMGFYAFCAVYWTAAHVNATFDVYLEGPMGAVWFWCVFGLAYAGTRVQNAHPRLLDRLGAPPPPPPPPPPAFGWFDAPPPAAADAAPSAAAGDRQPDTSDLVWRSAPDPASL